MNVLLCEYLNSIIRIFKYDTWLNFIFNLAKVLCANLISLSNFFYFLEYYTL